MDKLLTAKEAIAKIGDGAVIMIGGFGLRGCPDELVDELVASGVKDLTIISNDLGSPNQGLGRLMTNGQVKKLIGSSNRLLIVLGLDAALFLNMLNMISSRGRITLNTLLFTVCVIAGIAVVVLEIIRKRGAAK